MFHLGYSKYLVKSVYLEGLLGYLFGLLQYLRERDLDLVFRSYFSPDLVTKNNKTDTTKCTFANDAGRRCSVFQQCLFVLEVLMVFMGWHVQKVFHDIT